MPVPPPLSRARLLRAGLAVLVLALLASCARVPAAASPASAEPCPPGPGAIIVVVDGARYSETLGDPTHANIPQEWQRLAPAGIWSDSFYNDGITETMPGHSAILTGTWQPIANDGSQRPNNPTLFEYFRQATGLPAQCAVVVGGKAKLDAIGYSTRDGYGAPLGAETDVMDRPDQPTWDALHSRLDATHPRLVLLALSEVDRRGHADDWPGYLAAIKDADRIVGEVWDYVQTSDAYRGRTAVIVTNDHGRSATDFTTHGDGENSRHIVLFAAGAGVEPSGAMSGRHTQIELAATVGTILGFSTPDAVGATMPWARPIGVGAWLALPLVAVGRSAR
jgi:hypothetical protein